MERDPRPRVILHLDMDAFYAAVETRENPALAGRAVIVGHRGARGVVSTCSYEARRFGVRSAMPSVVAERLCPDAVWLPGRIALYVRVSREILRILEGVSPVVEPLSIDEAFVDLTGIARDLEDGQRIARGIVARIVSEQRLSGSAGIAPNKFLAKVASDLEKPDGLVTLSAEEAERRLGPMPVRRLWGVGPATAGRLAEGGLGTIGDLLQVPEAALVALVGLGTALHLRALARGEDDRPVVPHRSPKSVSEERTYAADLDDPDEIDREILSRSDGVARGLRREGWVARTVHLKVRSGDFTTWTRAHTLPEPTDLAEVLVRVARQMFRERIRLEGHRVRLLGVGASGLEPASSLRAPLFPDPLESRLRRVARASDAACESFGEEAVVRARLLRRGARRGGAGRGEPLAEPPPRPSD